MGKNRGNSLSAMNNISFNDDTQELEIQTKNGLIVYDMFEVKEAISFEYVDTILGYGDVYRYVKFGEHYLNDGRIEDIIEQICEMETEEVIEIIENSL